MQKLELSQYYSREQIHGIFSSDTKFTPQAGTWGLHGIVPVPNRGNDYVFFVTYGQQQGGHKFKEGVTDQGILTWQSQPSQGFQNKHIQSFINHNELTSNIYLFLRTKKGADYQYMGRLKYLAHDETKEKPVYFQWQLLDWLEIEYDNSMQVIETSKQEKAELGQANILTRVDTPEKSKGSGKNKPKTFEVRVKPDYSGKEASNRKLGLCGEELVLEFERTRLNNEGNKDLASLVQHTSVEEGDGAGYDIRSFSSDKEQVFIEVKTTKGSKITPFYMSINEVEFAKSHIDTYKIYRVYDYDNKSNSGKFFIIEGNTINELNYEPTQYRVKV
jgi:hypothetical protein